MKHNLGCLDILILAVPLTILWMWIGEGQPPSETWAIFVQIWNGTVDVFVAVLYAFYQLGA